MRERSFPNRLVVQFLVSLAVGALLAAIGPFGTYLDLPPADRYLYWMLIVPLNWVQIAGVIMLISLTNIPERWPRYAIVSLACLIASVPAAFEVLWLEHWLRPGHGSHLTVWFLWPNVLLLSLMISLPLKNYMWYRAAAAETQDMIAEPAMPSSGPKTPTFLTRLPPHLGHSLLCIEAEDHYLRVHTALGSDLTLYRMADALAELAADDGLQVHRSFWVARDAVEAFERDGKRVSLRLKNGLEVPVSRTFLPAVRAAGWLNGLSTPAGSGSAAGTE